MWAMQGRKKTVRLQKEHETRRQNPRNYLDGLLARVCWATQRDWVLPWRQSGAQLESGKRRVLPQVEDRNTSWVRVGDADCRESQVQRDLYSEALRYEDWVSCVGLLEQHHHSCCLMPKVDHARHRKRRRCPGGEDNPESDYCSLTTVEPCKRAKSTVLLWQ